MRVDYAQMYVLSGDAEPDIKQAFAGQANGLCGAAVPGALFLMTGLRFGEVGLDVEVHATEPPLGEEWEEAVEVSFAAQPGGVRLAGWESDGYELPVPPGDYRVRYCARGIDEGRDVDQLDEGADPVDFYLLQFWPAPPSPDRILRQTSDTEDEQYFLNKYGRTPNARLRAADGCTAGMVLLDRDLVIALSELDDDTLRDIARWAALRAVTQAGLAEHPTVAPAVAALRAGEPLPAPFDEEHGWMSAIENVPTRTPVPHLPPFQPGGDEDTGEWIVEFYGLSALNDVSSAPPLVAAVAAVESAAVAHGRDHYLAFLGDLRVTFPAVAP
ncbi:hypothetical protein [Paractinoplanes atraurantiacus]|uniref:Uncharacterized protein n=1 Tax=Paractinoplanes atraurantiacus TaxID=1036182 RepID=A0A285JKL4_9ACTN|nr:hypothetical protein [Actinoplanes atraurantiacus]SNY60852.1 hypothetical protein SAMN05421748_1225 [Actinoplanes atraurantiacus]